MVRNFLWYNGKPESLPSGKLNILHTNGNPGYDTVTVIGTQYGVEVRFRQGGAYSLENDALDRENGCVSLEGSTRCFTMLAPISPASADQVFDRDLPALLQTGAQRSDHPNITVRNLVLEEAIASGHFRSN